MNAIEDLLKQETIRRLEEGLGRIHKCVGMLSDDHLWHRPNANVVSIGNLILHLTGNVGQWIVATLGRKPDQRQRRTEFDTDRSDRVKLIGDLDRTIQQAKITINALSIEDLERIWEVQVYKESGVAILVHVAEHFSYHVGQITLHTKLLLDVDTGYYAGADLERRQS